MRLILARHGRTAANVAKALDTRPPGAPLDDVGREQAAQLAERLAGVPVSAVYASWAVRAQETGAAVAAVHDLSVVVLDGLQEADCGELEGATDPASHEQFLDVYEAWLNEEFEARLPGGESAHDVRARFVAAVESVAADKPVVVVSHGAAIRLGVGALLGEGAETRYVPNAGLVVLTGRPGRWTLEHWDGAEPVPGDVTGGAEIAW